MAKGFGGRGGGGLNMSMIKQAQKMQADIQKMQAALELKEYTANSGGGVVTATVSGKKIVTSLVINPEAVDPDDVDMLQDMVMAAINEAMRLADVDADTSMQSVTGGLSLPF